MERYGYIFSNWPQYLADKIASPVGPHCEQCNRKILIDSMEHSFSPRKTFYVELAQDSIDKLTLFEHIDICGFAFHLKALVRCYNKYFTCAARFENKWNFFDDLSYPVICFETLNDITRHYRTGWFFVSILWKPKIRQTWDTYVSKMSLIMTMIILLQRNTII